jgi:hypothetical protein
LSASGHAVGCGDLAGCRPGIGDRQADDLEAAAPDLRDIPWLSIDELDDAPKGWRQPLVLGSDVALLQYV